MSFHFIIILFCWGGGGFTVWYLIYISQVDVGKSMNMKEQPFVGEGLKYLFPFFEQRKHDIIPTIVLYIYLPPSLSR